MANYKLKCAPKNCYKVCPPRKYVAKSKINVIPFYSGNSSSSYCTHLIWYFSKNFQRTNNFWRRLEKNKPAHIAVDHANYFKFRFLRFQNLEFLRATVLWTTNQILYSIIILHVIPYCTNAEHISAKPSSCFCFHQPYCFD